MADKEGMNPLIQQALGTGGPTPTDPFAGLGSVLSPDYGRGRSSMEAPVAAGAVVRPEVPNDLGEVAVTGPKERKMSFLGQLLDGVSRAYGKPERYKESFEKKQLIDDLAGMAEDPMTAIQKVMRHNPAMGYKMYQAYVDDKRGDDALARQNRMIDMKEKEYFMDRMAGMLGTANPQNYEKVKGLVQRYAAARGVELPFDLPDQYDEDFISAARMGEVPIAKQESLNETRRYHDERLEDFDIQEGGRNSRFERGQANIDRRQSRTLSAAEARQQERLAAADRRAREKGDEAPGKEGQWQKKGDKLRRFKNGKWTHFKLVNGQLQLDQ